MKKRDFETYQKRFRDFEILPKFSETHVFRGTIRHPSHSIELILVSDHFYLNDVIWKNKVYEFYKYIYD